MSLFHQARFFTTANALTQLPDGSRFEIAFAGRSNAGKSSAINTLANHKRLAFTSKMPGRTQHLNYFSFGVDRYLVDLPGYGYAKVPRDIRRHWEQFLAEYLAQRDALRGMVLIMDARHPLTDLDWGMLQWFAPGGRPVHILLSKADKLTRQEQIATIASVRDGLVRAVQHPDAGPISVSLFSSLKKTGIEEAEGIIQGWIDEFVATDPLRATDANPDAAPLLAIVPTPDAATKPPRGSKPGAKGGPKTPPKKRANQKAQPSKKKPRLPLQATTA